MSGTTLPGTPEEETRVVMHVDMDCFYASCERLREPELAGEPLVVGMGYEAGESHGAVATASYEAREHGVESAQPISQALERLPRRADGANGSEQTGHYRPVDLDYYEKVASDVKEVLHDCADVVREVSIDEAYLDATDRTAWDVARDEAGQAKASSAAGATGGERTLAEGFARHVKERITREVGVPASVGVAPNMSTAKIASDYDKPDGLVVVRPGRVAEFLAPIGVEELHGVGPVTARDLGEMSIQTAGDVADADPAVLREAFGERGRELYERARGEDDREVTPTGVPKSLSRESAFTEATDDEERKRERVRALAADVADRARSRGALYGTIGIKVVEPPFEVHTRARSLPGPVADTDLLESVALDLLDEFDERAVRKLGVRVSKLDFAESDQASLTGWEDVRTTSEQEAEGSAGGVAASGDCGGATEADTGADDTDTADFDDADGDGGEVDDADIDDTDGQISLGDF